MRTMNTLMVRFITTLQLESDNTSTRLGILVYPVYYNMIDLTPRQQGMKAFLDDLPSFKNPFFEEDDAYWKWVCGWDDMKIVKSLGINEDLYEWD